MPGIIYIRNSKWFPSKCIPPAAGLPGSNVRITFKGSPLACQFKSKLLGHKSKRLCDLALGELSRLNFSPGSTPEATFQQSHSRCASLLAKSYFSPGPLSLLLFPPERSHCTAANSSCAGLAVAPPGALPQGSPIHRRFQIHMDTHHRCNVIYGLMEEDQS